MGEVPSPNEAFWRHGLFYFYTKDPRNNSRTVDCELQEFLRAFPGVPLPEQNCIDDERLLVRHPLISYGSHSHRHYVPSSLPGTTSEARSPWQR